MSIRRTFTSDGEVEFIDLSPHTVPAYQALYCHDCEQVRKHTLVAVSSLRGPIYMCLFCGREADPAELTTKEVIQHGRARILEQVP